MALIVLQIGRVDGFNQQTVRKDVAYTWTNKPEQNTGSASALGMKEVLTLSLIFGSYSVPTF